MKHAVNGQWVFEELKKNKPAPGSNDYPVALKAAHLDENFLRSTLIKSNQDPPLYDLEYTKDGTRLTRLLPDGNNTGDLLYWGGERWAVLAAPSSDTMHVLTITSGSLAWTETEACAE